MDSCSRIPVSSAARCGDASILVVVARSYDTLDVVDASCSSLVADTFEVDDTADIVPVSTARNRLQAWTNSTLHEVCLVEDFYRGRNNHTVQNILEVKYTDTLGWG